MESVYASLIKGLFGFTLIKRWHAIFWSTARFCFRFVLLFLLLFFLCVKDKQRFSQYKIKGLLVVGNNVSRIEAWQHKRIIRF